MGVLAKARGEARLSPEELAAIACAPPTTTAKALAEQLRRPYFTVAWNVRRIRRAGGWYCQLTLVPCSECGLPVAGPGTRQTHVGCEQARTRRYARERRQRKPGQSTPYVRAWRERHLPDWAHDRVQERERLTTRYHELPGQQQAAVLAKAHAADRRDYPLTLERADRRGEDWTEHEDTCVLETLKTPARDVALELGRTLWAVRSRRVRLLRERLILAELLAKVQRLGECWVWLGPIVGLRYGLAARDGRRGLAHRAIWEQVYGPLPAGRRLRGVCGRTGCVRPGHWRLVLRRREAEILGRA